MVETQRPSRTKSCRPGYDDHEKSCTCFPGGRSLVLHGLHVSCEDGVGCIQQYLSLMNLHQADLCEVKITQSRQLCDLYIFPKQVWPLCHCCVDLVSPISCQSNRRASWYEPWSFAGLRCGLSDLSRPGWRWQRHC